MGISIAADASSTVTSKGKKGKKKKLGFNNMSQKALNQTAK